MPVEIKLPALSESISEGVVAEVRIKAGDTLKPGDIVVVVEAEKSTVEVPADAGGKVTDVLVKKGDTVKVGQVLAQGGKRRRAPAAQKPDEKPEKPPAAQSAQSATKPQVAVATRASEGGLNGASLNGPRSAGDGALVPAGPATRRLARQIGNRSRPNSRHRSSRPGNAG